MPATLDDLLRLHLRPRTLVHDEKVTDGRTLAPTAPRFGGLPYMEADDVWPRCSACTKPLSFIAQLDLRGTPVTLPGMDLVAFYYCWDCFPQDPDEGPWTLLTYAQPADARAVAATPPPGVTLHPLREARYEAGWSLPDWETAYRVLPEAFALAKTLDAESPWETYHAATERVAGPQDLGTVIGGWPRWLQGFEPPAEGATFIAAIDSVGDGISWGDAGLVYLFVAADAARTPLLVLQSC